jgi:hypothetical protein
MNNRTELYSDIDDNDGLFHLLINAIGITCYLNLHISNYVG